MICDNIHILVRLIKVLDLVIYGYLRFITTVIVPNFFASEAHLLSTTIFEAIVLFFKTHFILIYGIIYFLLNTKNIYIIVSKIF